jgi:sugar phosphate permease
VTGAKKWRVMVLLCLAGSLVYWGPFFADIFYVPMQDAFGFTNLQMGALNSIYGTASMIGYFPGGWFADKFSARKLISVSLMINAAGAFVFATIPSFEICVIIFAVWGIATTLMLWSAMIKAIRGWGGKSEQGKAFGFLEGGRNISDSITTALLLALFAYFGGQAAAIDEVLWAQAMSLPIIAILVWLFLSDDADRDRAADEDEPVIDLRQIMVVLRLPIVWLLSIIIMAAYYGYWGSFYFSAYAVKALGMNEVLGSAIGGSKYWVAPPVAIAAGFVADKVGVARVVVWLFVVMTAGYFIFGFVSGAATLLPIMLINTAVVGIAVFALRGIYFALMEYGNVPIAVTGTATGVISILGFTPDIFAPLFGGYLFDRYPGEAGFQYYFLVIGTFSLIGTLAAVRVHHKFANAQE